MSNLVKHAEKELKIAGMMEDDSDYDGMLATAVLELVKLFSDQEHSGASAAMTVGMFKEVAMFRTLSPLTGEDSEWNKIGETKFQNNRNSGVFKDTNIENGRAFFLDAIVWQEPNGVAFTGQVQGIGSRQFIKEFPFVPKTFYIKIIPKDISPNDRVSFIQNVSDIDEVKEYYYIKDQFDEEG